MTPIFLSHGAPTLVLEPTPAHDFLARLSEQVPRPKAVLAVSAHWETNIPAVNAVAVNETIHDFYGFPEPLYDLRYPAPGDVGLARRALELITGAGVPAGADTSRGLDHGAWVPLMLAWPKADIPVVQLSVQTHLGAQHHYDIGRALQPLTLEGVLILASGSFTHNLRAAMQMRGETTAPAWVTQFAEWMNAALTEGRLDDLLNYRRLAPHAVQNHPTEEHLLPLFVALGAAGGSARADLLHTSVEFGALRMDAHAFAKAA